MKINYAILSKLNNLTAKEMDLLLYIAKDEHQEAGHIEMGYCRDMIKYTCLLYTSRCV